MERIPQYLGELDLQVVQRMTPDRVEGSITVRGYPERVLQWRRAESAHHIGLQWTAWEDVPIVHQ